MPAVPVSFVYGSRDWMDPRHAHDLVTKLAVPASVRAARLFISQCRCACMAAGNVAAGSRCVEQRAPHVRARAVQCAPSFAVTCAPNRYLENSVEFNSTMQHILAEQPVPM
jgi:hypothetical protein